MRTRTPRLPVTCKDCRAEGITRHRPTPHPGPRCASHHRAVLRARRLAAAARHVQRRYGITEEERAAILAVQGGACAGCGRAKDRPRKRLATDHDHRVAATHDHPPDQGCAMCVRGLLCSPCNDTLAHFRDDPAGLLRLARYLREWPAASAGI